MMIGDFMGGLHFLDPDFLYLLLPLCILFLLWLGITIAKIIKRPEKTYGSRYPLIGKIKLWGLFVVPAGIMMVLAMARPSLDRGILKASRGNIEVIIVIDRSISMRADDVKPTRLDIAVREASNIQSLLMEGDKAALFVFGKESHTKILLLERFEQAFDHLSEIQFPEGIKNDGLVWNSDFAAMLENIYRSMDRQDAYIDGYSSEDYSAKKYVPKKRSNRIVIIFSDGEDQFRKSKPTIQLEAERKNEYVKRFNSALAEFKKRGLKIYPVGIGTERGVKWLSLLRGYKKGIDYEEELIQYWKNGISRINKENLRYLSRATGANIGTNIWTIENGTTVVKSYLGKVISSNRKSLLEFSRSDSDSDLWQLFLLIAAGFLILGIAFHPVQGYLSKRNRN
ncbi:MAG: VWA domain-containing protein [Candidatus Yanofskybacteria bacterium]|nr:VWA domain-containing protein [Candidatus Yanofskybacteria bacterium]